MEVHDLENRLATITTLLRRQGFARVVVEQQPFLKGYETHNLYALRTAPEASAPGVEPPAAATYC